MVGSGKMLIFSFPTFWVHFGVHLGSSDCQSELKCPDAPPPNRPAMRNEGWGEVESNLEHFFLLLFFAIFYFVNVK